MKDKNRTPVYRIPDKKVLDNFFSPKRKRKSTVSAGPKLPTKSKQTLNQKRLNHFFSPKLKRGRQLSKDGGGSTAAEPQKKKRKTVTFDQVIDVENYLVGCTTSNWRTKEPIVTGFCQYKETQIGSETTVIVNEYDTESTELITASTEPLTSLAPDTEISAQTCESVTSLPSPSQYKGPRARSVMRRVVTPRILQRRKERLLMQCTYRLKCSALDLIKNYNVMVDLSASSIFLNSLELANHGIKTVQS